MVTGTGPGGIVQADDVLRFQAPAVSSPVITPGAEYTDIQLTGMRKVQGTDEYKSSLLHVQIQGFNRQIYIIIITCYNTDLRQIFIVIITFAFSFSHLSKSDMYNCI